MKHTRSLIQQASILAFAGILVRIIGVLYRGPLTEIITAEGIGYYSTAYNIYAMILLISSYSIPTAISKLISEKLVLQQYNNAQKILKCSFLYISVVGGAAALITFFLAPYIVTKNAIPALQVLAPTIFLSGLLGVFRGYFQAHQTTIYTSISQIAEQVFNAIVSVAAAWLFVQPYLLAGGTEMASIGAAGSAVGTGVGVLIGLIYMAFIYLKNKHRYLIPDANEYPEDSYKSIFRMILLVVTPIIFATCIYNLTTTIDTYLYYFAMGDTARSASMFGIYSGQYIVLQNVPVAIAAAMSAASIPAISSAWSVRNKKQTHNYITSGIRTTMLILIPSAIGLSVLAFPIIGLIFPQKETVQTATLMLALGSPSVIFFGLSTLTNGILQALNEVKKPVKNAAIALAFHCPLTIILLNFTDLGLFALVISNLLYGLHVCYLNQKSLRRKIRYKQNIKQVYLLPLFASVIMGIVVGVCYYGLFAITRTVFLPLCFSIIVGIVVYFMVVLYIYGDRPDVLSDIPYIDRLVYKFKK